MKTLPKAKSLLIKKTKRRRKALLASAKLAYVKMPVIRHLRLIEPKHTGKLISHRHTSHAALMLILITLGVFLYASQGISWAAKFVSGGSVSIGAVVPGPPPTIGAVITSPVNGTTVSTISVIQVAGSCARSSFVVIYDNKSLAGSTSCDISGNFSLPVQLLRGDNSLTALNFDNLNQAGPITPSVLVKVEVTQVIVTTPTSTSDSPSSPKSTQIEAPMPQLPINPAIIGGLSTDMSSCADYTPPAYLKTGGDPHIEFVCVPRLVDPLLGKDLGLLAWGGEPPYAISLSWGIEDKSTIVSMPAPGYKTIGVKYDVAGFFNVRANLVDTKANSTVASTSVQVNGTPVSQKTVSTVVNSLKTSITDSTVPLYILAVAITLGFWGGDIFDRYYGARYKNTNKRRAAR